MSYYFSNVACPIFFSIFITIVLKIYVNFYTRTSYILNINDRRNFKKYMVQRETLITYKIKKVSLRKFYISNLCVL